MKNYGEKIAYYRRIKGISQSELAEKLNLTRQAISRWERGNTEPDLDSIIKLCKIFEITTDEFLIGEAVDYVDKRSCLEEPYIESSQENASSAGYNTQEATIPTNNESGDGTEKGPIITKKKQNKYPNIKRPSCIFKLPVWISLTSVCAVLLVAVIIGSQFAFAYKKTINSFLGLDMYYTVEKESEDGDEEETEYFKSNYSSVSEVNSETKKLSLQEQREGTTILWNNDNAFPLGKVKVSLFGLGALAYANSGSGSGTSFGGLDMKTAFENTGLKVNATLWNAIYSETDYWKYDSTYKQYAKKKREIPWANMNSKSASSYSDYSDAAIYVLTRKSGEVGWGNDTKTEGAGTIDGDYYSLYSEEKEIITELIKLKKNGTFSKIVVLLNTAEGIGFRHLSEFESDIDACVWIGQGGTYGLEEVGRIITGESTPSGHLPDTFVYSGLSAPASVNHEYDTYTNVSGKDWGSEESANNTAGRGYFMSHYTIYAEGIYIGYKYYETRYEDTVLSQGNATGTAGVVCSTSGWNYSEEVAYPYGYGLSYTTFDYGTPTFIDNGDGSYTVKITVTNTGSKDGSDAVQVYIQRPYTEHDKQYKIEQASVNLVGFKKTAVIKPGNTETVEIKVAADAFKTYDAFDKKTYIREAGKYYLTVAQDSHEAINNILAAKGKTPSDGMDAEGNVNLVKEITFTANDYTTFSKSSTGATITNKFENCDWNTYENKDSTTITYLSRNDWNGTYPQKVQLSVNAKMYDDLDWDKEYEADPNDVMPKYGEQNGLYLIDLRGKDYDDPMWDSLLDETTLDEQIELMRAAYGTSAMASIVKPGEGVNDGPLGIQRNFTATSLLAASYNEELAEKVGELMGEYAFHTKKGGIYAPGANMHRSMYGGRGYEYYSEDTFLSSRMLAMQVRGIQSLGVYVNIKHFVLNDQDSSRKGISTWVNEQALREVYLETFRACVEEENAMGVMTGFNRIGTTWCGALSALNNGVLREEWGFKGFVISDCPWQVYMGTVDGLFGGNDCILYESIDLTQYEKAKTNATIALKLREATKHILYVVVNSSAMNGYGTSTEIVYYTSWWWSKAIIALIVAFAVLFLSSATMLVITILKQKKYKTQCATDGVSTKEYESYYKSELYEKPKPVKIGKLFIPHNIFVSVTAIVLAAVIAGLSFATVGVVGAVKSANHKCENVCLVCGKCADSTCREKNCSDKCQGNHVIADIKNANTYVFEAEDAVLAEVSTTGTLKASKGKESSCTSSPSGGAYIYKISQTPAGTQVIFKVNAEETCAAGLIMTMGHNGYDTELSSLFTIKVNGKAAKIGKVVFTKCTDDEPLYFTFKDTEIGILTLKKGVNTVTFTKTNGGLNFDCIKLVSATTIEKVKACEEHKYAQYISRKSPTLETEGAVWSYCKVCGTEDLKTLPTISEENGYTKNVITESTMETTGEAEWTYNVGEQEFKFTTDLPLLPDTRPKTDYKLEAEDALISTVNGKVTVKDADTASGGKYVDDMGNDENGASLSWTFNVDKACNVNISVGMIKHHNDTRNFDDFYKVTINGVRYKTGLTIEKTGETAAWTTFYNFELLNGVELKTGSNTIVFERIGNALNLDYVTISSAENVSLTSSAGTQNVLKIEAEDCTLVNTAKVYSTDKQYDVNDPSGGNFVGSISSIAGSGVSFAVTVEKDCTAQLVLCYGNRTNDTTDKKFASKFSLTLNDEALLSDVVFNTETNNNYNYFGWEEYTICTVQLKAGKNIFKMISTGVTSSNIDYFKLFSLESLVKADITDADDESEVKYDKELKIEAENCTLGGAAVINSEENSNNPSGGKYVGKFGTKGSSVTFTVTAEKACKAQLVLCYGNRANIADAFATRFTFTLNGKELVSTAASNKGTPDWFGWEEYVICTVDLAEGDNTFVVTAIGASGTSNIDYFKVLSTETTTHKNV